MKRFNRALRISLFFFVTVLLRFDTYLVKKNNYYLLMRYWNAYCHTKKKNFTKEKSRFKTLTTVTNRHIIIMIVSVKHRTLLSSCLNWQGYWRNKITNGLCQWIIRAWSIKGFKCALSKILLFKACIVKNYAFCIVSGKDEIRVKITRRKFVGNSQLFVANDARLMQNAKVHVLTIFQTATTALIEFRTLGCWKTSNNQYEYRKT